MKKTHLGWLSFILFIISIPICNWMIGNVGRCIPNGPCLLPVWPYPLVEATSGVWMIGVALVARDLLQRTFGLKWSIGAIAIGAIVSAIIAPPALVFASVIAYTVAELIDTAVYTPLVKHGLVTAAIASSLVGIVIDSVLFLQIAFGSTQYITGQIIGKAWGVLIAVIVLKFIAKRLDSVVNEPQLATR